jgi:medium-chain acyl-[acyl-carrier-protein] hydrolase
VVSSVAANPWLIHPRPNPAAALRLFCLPHAGGGANLFRHWPAGLPAGVEVCAIQLPGRETRFSETPFARCRPLVEALADAMTDAIDRPYVLFGHSLGALVASELARRLRHLGRPEPAHLITAGYPAPQAPRRNPPVHALPDEQFRAELRRRGGTPDVVLENTELINLFARILRADFAVCETYRFHPEPPLRCAITALGAPADPTMSLDDLAGWQQHSTGPFDTVVIPGGHFFPTTHQGLVLEHVSRILNRYLSAPRSAWHKPPQPPALAEDEVQIYRFGLKRPAEEVAHLAPLLDPSERERADKFRFPADRDQYIVGRALLRCLLAAHVRQAPQELRFAYAAAGKPLLRDHGLQFNLAHSGGLALLALAGRRAVGVDVEHLNRPIEITCIADRYFNPEEQAVLKAEPAAERLPAFFRAWTRKEAYMKATGQGLSMPLERFAVLPAPGASALRLQTLDPPQEAARWSLRDLDVQPAYVGAVAVGGHGWRLTCLDLPEQL